MQFLLSSQINDLKIKSLICAPLHGRDDDLVKSHQYLSREQIVMIVKPSILSFKNFSRQSFSGFDSPPLAAY